jgi:hypothetical protein
LFSANIDSRFKPSIMGGVSGAGLGFVTSDEEVRNGNNFDYESRSVVTVPLQINYIFGKPSSVHTFEAGGGLTVVSKKIDILNYTTLIKQTCTELPHLCIAGSPLMEVLCGVLVLRHL